MAAAKSDSPKVFAAIGQVMHDLAELGIGKDSRNQQQGFNFRGVDAVYNTLSPVLAKNKLAMLPRVVGRQCDVRETGTGKAMYFVTVNVEFDIVSCEDGSKHTVSVIGEASDMADKATNKAMSAAFKYACFMAFCIPLSASSVDDADTFSPEETVVNKPKQRKRSATGGQPAAVGVNVPKDVHGRPMEAVGANAIADIMLRIESATDDVTMRQVASEVYRTAPRVPANRREEFCKAALGKRSTLVGADMIDNMGDMAKAFAKSGYVSQADANVLLNAARSRLNMEPVELSL